MLPFVAVIFGAGMKRRIVTNEKRLKHKNKTKY